MNESNPTKKRSQVAALCLLVSSLFTSVQAQQPSLKLPEKDSALQGVGPIRRYDWFVNLWNQRREAWAARADQDKGAVVFLGDSITQGWGDDFKGMFAGLKTANRGISGDTSRGMLYRLSDDVIKLQPKAVVLLMGTNDLEEKAEPEMVRDNLRDIIAALNKHDAKLPIVLCKVMPSSASKARPAEKIKRINELLVELAKEKEQVTLVETWKIFANESGDAKTEEFPDLLHPNDAGYKKWSSAIRPVFIKLGLIDLLKPTNRESSWNFEEHMDGKGSISVDGDKIVFKTTKTGSENWHVQVYQLGLDIQEGGNYELTFMASSPDSRRVIVAAGINEEDWHGIGLFEELSLGKTADTYSLRFTASDTKPGNNRLGFILGDELGTVMVSQMRLKKLD